MKRILLISIAAFILSCQQSKEVNIDRQPLVINKNVGQQIPLDVAERWRARKNLKQGRDGNNYTISAATLRNALNPIEDKLGVVLQHALDSEGGHHIFVVPINEGVELANATIIVDANSDSFIELDVARAWTRNYQLANAHGPLYHFFGSVIFQEIEAHPSFNLMEIQSAENDEGEPQLLLYVRNDFQNGGGRINEDNLVVYDYSSPCPPCAGIL